MKERPILFSAPMVRALLDGTKSQTRRIVTLPHMNPLGEWEPSTVGGPGAYLDKGHTIPAPEVVCIWHTRTGDCIGCPYGVPGERLWVRETWAHDGPDLETVRARHEDALGGESFGPYYRASEVAPSTLRWRSPIHMPRWASRILLEVTDVRVERLQDISESDAIAEGVQQHLGGWFPYGIETCLTTLVAGKEVPAQFCRDAIASYRMLWESINGAGSWETNPWVWAISFKRIGATA